MLSSAWYPLPRKSLPKKRLEKGATDLVGGRSATMSLTLTNPGAVSARRTRACGSPAAAQRDHQQAYLHFLGRESTFLLILRRLVSRQSLRPVFDCPSCRARTPREKVPWMR